MALLLENLLERLLNQFGLSNTEKLAITIALGLLVFFYSFYKFPKNKKRTFDVISVKAMMVLWCVIGVSLVIIIQFSSQYTYFAFSSILLSWIVYSFFFGKELWVGLSKMRHQPGYSDSMVLMSSLLAGSVIVITSVFILAIKLFNLV